MPGKDLLKKVVVINKKGGNLCANVSSCAGGHAMPYILPRLYVSLEMRLIKSKKKLIYVLCGGLRFLTEKTYDLVILVMD